MGLLGGDEAGEIRGLRIRETPTVLAALEEAMEPNLRDMRERERMRKENEGKLIEGSSENEGQGEAN